MGLTQHRALWSAVSQTVDWCPGKRNARGFEVDAFGHTGAWGMIDGLGPGLADVNVYACTVVYTLT